MIVSRFLSNFFPNYCPGCGGEIDFNETLCVECANAIKGPLLAPFKLPHVESAYSYWFYETPLKEVIQAYKFLDRPRLANRLSEMLFEMFCKIGTDISTVVPVPTTLAAFKKRGFDTNYTLLKKLSKKLSFELEDALAAVGNRVPQSQLKIKEREESVKGKFFLRKALTARKVILFDDVLTTGATASQCAKVLREGGAEKVILFTLAKTKK